jgi:flagellar assembly factor FliW
VIFETSRFGQVKAGDELIFFFPEGLIGMPYTSWVLITTDLESPFLWLQSTEAPELALPITLPAAFFPNYDCEISLADAQEIEMKDTSQAEIFCIVSAKEKVEDFTINLSGPLVINEQARRGIQVVNPREEYSVRASLWQEIEISEFQAVPSQLPILKPGEG